MTSNEAQGQVPSHDEAAKYQRSDEDRTPSPSPTGTGLSRPLVSATGGLETSASGGNEESSGVKQYDYGRIRSHRSDLAQRAMFKARIDHRPDSFTPAPPGMGHPILHTGHANGVGHRRSRPETSHQRAVNMNRKMRTDHILHKKLLKEHNAIRKEKKRYSSSFGFTAMRRIKDLPDDYDTDNENSRGPGGLVPNVGEHEDFGEEALRHKKALDRAVRRLLRDECGGPLSGLVDSYRKRKKRVLGYENGAEDSSQRRGRDNNALGTRADRSLNSERPEEGLDDLDLDLLGESRDDDQVEDEIDEDSGMEDSEGEGDDVTEDETMHDE